MFVAGMPHGRLTEFTVSESPLAGDCPHDAFVGKPFSIDDVLQTITEVADVETAR